MSRKKNRLSRAKARLEREIKDNTSVFGKKPEIASQIDEFHRKKERIKAGKMHEEFKAEFVKEGKTGAEAFQALEDFKDKLRAEIKDEEVLRKSVQVVNQMKTRLFAMLSIPEKPAKPEEN